MGLRAFAWHVDPLGRLRGLQDHRASARRPRLEGPGLKVTPRGRPSAGIG